MGMGVEIYRFFDLGIDISIKPSHPGTFRHEARGPGEPPAGSGLSERIPCPPSKTYE